MYHEAINSELDPWSTDIKETKVDNVNLSR